MNDQITTRCPCGADQGLMTNDQRRGEFMSCSRFPECKETASVPAWISMKRSGVMELPGLETDERA
jgi:ssDNA-binding Zn-finger/Zn-ribbon topoisomerase 1